LEKRTATLLAESEAVAAKAMGYDSCSIIGFDIDKVAELINLPEDYVIGPMVAIGKKVKDPWPKPDCP